MRRSARQAAIRKQPDRIRFEGTYFPENTKPQNYTPKMIPTKTNFNIFGFIYTLFLNIISFIRDTSQYIPILKPLDEQTHDSDTESEYDTSDEEMNDPDYDPLDEAEEMSSDEETDYDTSDEEENSDPDYDPKNDSEEMTSDGETDYDTSDEEEHGDPDYNPMENIDNSDVSDEELDYSDKESTSRRCSGITKKGDRCKITTDMGHDPDRPTAVQDAAIRMSLEGGQFCSIHSNQTTSVAQALHEQELEIPVSRPVTHPVIYGMGASYRSSMSSYEKNATIQEAHEYDGVPIDTDMAWDFLTKNPELKEKYNVKKYC